MEQTDSVKGETGLKTRGFPGASMTRILIADDHEVVRSGLRLILEAHAGWQVVAEAADGAAIDKALETKPDVAILDYAIPLVNGVEVTRQIRRNPQIEVLIFTMHDSEALVPRSSMPARAPIFSSRTPSSISSRR